MASVTLKGVSKRYGKDVVAVKSVNIEIADKQFVVLVGPSGCGKSTILRMIAGLEEITTGELYIGERLVNDVSPKDRNIAMVFQNYALYPHMTVFENMAFGLKLRKYAKNDIRNRVKEAADTLEIGNLLHRKPKALSGGQRQRVALGRAIVRNPQVFLFDEPLSNLDAKLRVQMRTELSKLHNRLQTTMIYVTHDQVEAMTMGDQIVVLKHGVVQQIGTPLNIYNFPRNKFVAGFIGSPAMNFLSGRIVRDSGVWFDAGTLRLQLTRNQIEKLGQHIDTDVFLGIRPEDIYDARAAGNINEKSDARFNVEVVEPIGNEIYLHVASGTDVLIARLNSQFEYGVRDRVDLIFDTAKAHYFEKQSEETIL